MLIETHNLSFMNTIFYPDIHVPCDLVSFVSGPSGCGKTTLFKLLNATVSPSSGFVTYNGKDIRTSDKIELRRNILLAGQVPYLFQGSIYDNFKLFHAYHESVCPNAGEISDFLRECCLDAAPDALCDTMSGGERQRVFLSIALSMRPDVLLLDEPTSALNFDLSVELFNHIIPYAKQKHTTLLIISHDTSLQTRYAENIIRLEART